MNEVDEMCKNVEHLADKLQAVRACQGYQSQVFFFVIFFNFFLLLLYT